MLEHVERRSRGLGHFKFEFGQSLVHQSSALHQIWCDARPRHARRCAPVLAKLLWISGGGR